MNNILLTNYLQNKQNINMRRDSHLEKGTSHRNELNLINKNSNIEKQMEVLVGTFKEYTEQNSKLTSLYENAKHKNQSLTKINYKISQDIQFLKEYCSSLEQELQKLGFYKTYRDDMLSRKETAQGIFLSYNESTLSLEENLLFNNQHSSLNNCILNSENENRLLKQQLETQIHETLTKSVQATSTEPEKIDFWSRAYEISEERVARLEDEVKELKSINESLQMERQKRGANNFIMKDQQKLFNNIHDLIKEYKRKMKQLGCQKKQVEKRYKQLKEKVSKMDENSQSKLIELYAEKIDVLQRLTEKQQVEIQNTIQLYEIELKKIEEKRRQEIQMFENERIDLESENLKLCIDLQKSLNKRDDISLLLVHQKNKNQILLREIIELKQIINSQKLNKRCKNSSLHLVPQSISLLLDPLSSLDKVVFVNGNKIFTSQNISQRVNNENVSTQNIQYEYSQTSESHQLIDRIQEIFIPKKGMKREKSINKQMVKDKIKITYGHHYVIPTYGRMPNNSSNSNKSYDSVIQYKKRFIQRKPQSSINQQLMKY